MKFFKFVGVLLIICFLTGCASPPKPPAPHGEYHPVNNFSDLGKFSISQKSEGSPGARNK